MAVMNDTMECMCVQCGISNYVESSLVLLEEIEGSCMKVLKGTFCLECGGPLILLGAVGDQTHYQAGSSSKCDEPA